MASRTLCREWKASAPPGIDDLILDKAWTVEDIRIVRDAVQQRLDDLEKGRGRLTGFHLLADNLNLC